MLPKAIAVVGPTAAGKTRIGVALAEKFNGEIVSADSRQVYKYLDICTGKDKDDYGKIPYHLIDILEPGEEITAADFQKEAFAAITQIIKKKKLPILVGGSPFYVYSVTEGWQFPKIEKDPVLRKKLSKLSLVELSNILQKIDPKACENIDMNNPRRVLRAIEVCIASGKNFAASRPKPNPRYDFLYLGIKFPNEVLKSRIQKRLKERLEEGMIEEVKNIIKKKQASYKDLERMGLEPRFISYYLQKKINKEQLEDLLLKNIYHFAKRQMTWFRKDKRINWINDFNNAVELTNKFLLR